MTPFSISLSLEPNIHHYLEYCDIPQKTDGGPKLYLTLGCLNVLDKNCECLGHKFSIFFQSDQEEVAIKTAQVIVLLAAHCILNHSTFEEVEDNIFEPLKSIEFHLCETHSYPLAQEGNIKALNEMLKMGGSEAVVRNCQKCAENLPCAYASKQSPLDRADR